MIGEFGVPVSYGDAQRAQWLRAAQHVVQADRQIKALLYFDANPAGQGPQGSYALGGDAPRYRCSGRWRGSRTSTLWRSRR